MITIILLIIITNDNINTKILNGKVSQSAGSQKFI